jgi:hypothetical protein
MSLITMGAELTGCAPGIDQDLAIIKIKEAWETIRKLRGWSFQFASGGFSTPAALRSGTVTINGGFGGTTVTGDAVASALWNGASQYGSLVSQRQFRIGGGTIYNIVALNNTNPSAIVITLDRAYTDPLTSYTAAPGYLIYQPYLVVPVRGFTRWLAVRDMTNVRWLNIDADYQDRRTTDKADPQRQLYTQPLMLLPYQTDQRAGSPTIGWFQYEMYPQPTSQYAYQTWYAWDGPDLVNPNDVLPSAITENMVKCLARVGCYEHAEANKDPQNPRGAGGDFRFLMGAAQKQYESEKQVCRTKDLELVNMFMATFSRIGSPAPFSTYNPQTGVLSVSNLAQTS